MSDPRAALDASGQLPDVELDIAGVALQFARIDAPDRDWRAAGAHLSELARDAVDLARDLPGNELAARAGALAGLIGGRHRYAGDAETYDDPANANLIQVTERRRGLPVSLGILWLHCARAAGWSAHGLDFPGHFLIALQGDRPGGKLRAPEPQAIVLDVFAGGVPLGARDLRGIAETDRGRQRRTAPRRAAAHVGARRAAALAEQLARPAPGCGRPARRADMHRGHAADCARHRGAVARRRGH